MDADDCAHHLQISRAHLYRLRTRFLKEHASFVAKLSGGECQRVAIARALVNRPSVILADEPTGNLDERTGAEIMDLLLGVVAERGAALILVTHSREFAERAHRRFVLSGGVLTPA